MQTNTNSPFLSVMGLGQFKSEYSSKGRGRWVTVAFGLLLLAATPVSLLIALYVGYDTLQRRGWVKVAESVALPLIIAGVCFLLALGILITAWRNWTLAAAVYDNGVALNSRKGVQQMAWADVTAVWQAVTKHYTNGVYTGTTHVYTLQSNTGEKLVFDDRLGKGVEQLGTALQDGVSKVLFPRYAQALDNGQKVTFGPLALDREKFYSGKKELTWAEVPAVKIDKGIISVRKEGKGWFNWTAVSVPQIPNFYVFITLLNRLGKLEK